MKYLIVKCDELGDQFECDANRTPICLTDDYSKYGRGYEVYEVTSNKTFKCIKDYEEELEKGIAIYIYNENKKPKIFKKIKNLVCEAVSKSQIKQWKKQYHFSDTVEDIFDDINYCGSHGEEINGNWTVIGEYFDDDFSSGF